MPIIAIFITLISGILWQGGELFWFGPAAASSVSLCLVFFHKSLKKTISLPKSYTSKLLILFTGWCFLTVLWSDIPAVSLIHAFTIGSAMVGFYCYFFLSSSQLSWQQIWIIIISAALILAAISFVQLLSGLGRPNSLFINPNTFSAYLNLIVLPTVGYFLISTKPTRNKFLAITLFLLVYSQALTGSRGASLGQYIGLAMIFFVGRSEIKSLKLKQFLATYLSAILLATLTASGLSRMVSHEMISRSDGRWDIWQASFQLLGNTPWYGSGVGTYWLLYPPYRLFSDPAGGQNPHNDYLQYLIEAGIPGLGLLLLLMVYISYTWWKYITNYKNNSDKKIEATALMAAITAIGFHSLFTFNLGIFSILFLIGLILGRFIFITGQTKSIVFLSQLSVRKSIFRLTLGITLFFILSYLAAISTSSYLLTKANTAYSEGRMTAADEFNAMSLSLYPFNDRAHLLYSLIYKSIIKNISELTFAKKQQFYHQALGHLEKARSLNPLRPNSYFIQAQLIEENPELSGDDWQAEVLHWYQLSLKADPRFILASSGLANYHLSQNDLPLASLTIYRALRYQYSIKQKETLKFYNFAKKVLKLSGNNMHKKLLQEKWQSLSPDIKQQVFPPMNGTQ